MLRGPFWGVQIAVSVLVHALISARVGEDIQAGIDDARRAAAAT
jgi:hypothetical protein